MFKIGDRVRAIKRYEKVDAGITGTIIHFKSAEWGLPNGVKWDINIKGHNLEERCPTGYGYYVPNEYIELEKVLSWKDKLK